ncbi:MAG: tryptophan-rich sensory protein [Negativicutes bacterium]|nr:tryptophan-rich sensory protein [Negativicutes bacterium]
MRDYKVKGYIRILVGTTFLLMIVINALANIMKFNGQTTGDVANAYPNLFAPAAVTFAIWGVIYLLLAAYTLYQLGLLQDSLNREQANFLGKIGFIFSLSSLANAAWIFAWHYHQITPAMILMLVILSCLIAINRMILQRELSPKERFFIQIPFSVYFGWITVATIANATTLLVSKGWNGFGLTETVWTAILLAVGTLLGVLTMLLHQDFTYGLVMIWAYLGIWLKHTGETGFAGRYPLVVSVTLGCIAVFVLAEIYLIIKKIRER